ncbi:hypothetical protein [Rathayibacter sp. SD072]|nr:hypothetical protein [Rathayibacter sp. SD072]
MILHLAYYVGWGNASAVSDGVEEALAEFAEHNHVGEDPHHDHMMKETP